MSEARRSTNEPKLSVRNLSKWFEATGGPFRAARTVVRAVDDVSFEVRDGETVGMVGESGSGKTTIGRCILRLIDPSGGAVSFDGEDITRLPERRLRSFRLRAQPIFQDPYASLDPRMRAADIVAEPLIVHGLARDREARRQRVAELFRLVGLAPEMASRYPHEFSGGQRQRIGIARALAVDPSFIVADEPVSALDVSIQAQIVNLLRDLKQRLGLTMLFIAHDLAVVEYLSDTIIVLYLGRIMEVGPARALCTTPKHPYTEALLSAVPTVDTARRRRRIVMSGDVPSPINPPSGCVFRTRCLYALPACSEAVPPLRPVGPGRFKACIRDDVP